MLTREPSLYFSVLLLEMKIEMWSSAKTMHEHLILTISLNRINPEKLKRQKAAMRTSGRRQLSFPYYSAKSNRSKGKIGFFYRDWSTTLS